MLAIGMVAVAAVLGAQDEQKSVPLQSNKLNFVIHEPHGYTPEQRWPLFVILHGTGDSAENFIMVWDHEFARKKMFMIAINGTGKRWNDATDRPAIYEAVEYMKKKYAIDPNNIWLGGFSAGGGMTNRTVAANPGAWRGFFQAGSGGNASPSMSKLAAYLMCGETDSALPAAKALFGQCKQAGLKCEFNELQGYGHRCPQEKTPEALRWMIEIMDQVSAVANAKPEPAKFSATIAFSSNETREALDAFGQKVQEAANTIYKMTGGQLSLEKAKVKDRAPQEKFGLDVSSARLARELLQLPESCCGDKLCGKCWAVLKKKYPKIKEASTTSDGPKVKIEVEDK